MVIINDCPSQLALKTTQILDVLQPRNMRQTSRLDRFPAVKATDSCYEACGTFNYATNAKCDETIIYNNPVFILQW
jgi:hypothetical protein